MASNDRKQTWKSLTTVSGKWGGPKETEGKMCVSTPGGSRLGWSCKAGGSKFDSSRKRNWVQISIYAFSGVLYRVKGWCKPLQSGISAGL